MHKLKPNENKAGFRVVPSSWKRNEPILQTQRLFRLIPGWHQVKAITHVPTTE